jgi:hypothetical protein
MKKAAAAKMAAAVFVFSISKISSQTSAAALHTATVSQRKTKA